MVQDSRAHACSQAPGEVRRVHTRAGCFRTPAARASLLRGLGSLGSGLSSGSTGGELGLLRGRTCQHRPAVVHRAELRPGVRPPSPSLAPRLALRCAWRWPLGGHVASVSSPGPLGARACAELAPLGSAELLPRVSSTVAIIVATDAAVRSQHQQTSKGDSLTINLRWMQDRPLARRQLWGSLRVTTAQGHLVPWLPRRGSSGHLEIINRK